MPPLGLPTPTFIIDSDGGVDDALCVAYAARLLEPKQLIVSSVFGNVDVAQASKNLGFILSRMGFADHAIWEGAAEASDGFKRTAREVHGADGLGGAAAGWQGSPVIRPLSELHGDIANRGDGRFKILGIGPATNVPNIIDAVGHWRIDDITLMSGSVFDVGNVTRAAEFNAFNDPGAINKVLASGIPVNIVPLDICRKVIFEKSNIKHLRKLGDIADILIPAHEHYMGSYERSEGIEGCYPHDSIALMVSMFPSQFHGINVELEAEIAGPDRGRLIVRGLDRDSRVRVFTGGNLKWLRALFNTDVSLQEWLSQASANPF